MKIAIATFGERVSPRFDCAPTFLIVTAENAQVSKGRQLIASEWAPHDRINKLVDLGVDMIVCGGIDWWSAESLRSAGVKIYCQVAGEIDEALAALVRGDLEAEAVLRDAPGHQHRFGACDAERDQGGQSGQEPHRSAGYGRGRRGGRGGCGRGGVRA